MEEAGLGPGARPRAGVLGDAEGRGVAARARRAPPPPPRQQRAARARVYVPRGAADVTAEWQHCGDAETQSLGVGSLVPAGLARSAGGRAAAGQAARANADARLSASAHHAAPRPHAGRPGGPGPRTAAASGL